MLNYAKIPTSQFSVIVRMLRPAMCVGCIADVSTFAFDSALKSAVQAEQQNCLGDLQSRTNKIA